MEDIASDFTYIIRSDQKENLTDNTNSCSIRLGGLPQQYRYFECSVSALHISTYNLQITTSTFELRSDNIGFLNGKDTKNNILHTLAFASFNNTYPQGPYKFKIDNFNGRSVNFRLLGDTGLLLTTGNTNITYNSPWILVLNMVGYN